MSLLIGIYFSVFGLLIGSFLNVIIIRLPKNQSWALTRSKCPQCESELKWFHNIPVISFILLKGKCGFCGKKISSRYLKVELLTSLISWCLMPERIDIHSMGLYFFYFSIACIFICHFFIDLDHHLLLDSLNLYLLAIILPYSLIRFDWSFWVSGGLIGFFSPLAVTWLFYKLRGQVGLGGGDIKLYGVLGILFGPIGIIFTIFMSCFVGAIVGLMLIAIKNAAKDTPMAFGPAILIVGAFQIYFPDYANYLQSLMFGMP